jgi:hypothetical protein
LSGGRGWYSRQPDVHLKLLLLLMMAAVSDPELMTVG